MRIPPNPAAALLLWGALILAGCGGDGTGSFSDDARIEPTTDAGQQTQHDLSEDTGDDVRDSGDADGGLGPPYPIVLAHGMFGFEHLADIDELPYYYGVREMLEERGEPVLVTEVNPLADSDVRGRRLLEHIEEYLSDTGYARVNIIGHSQGGLDARWVAHERPDLVASVVTIASPHGGTRVADIVLELVDSDRFQSVVDAVVELAGQPLYDELGKETSLFDPLRLFSQPGIEAFNQRITDQPGVYYASVAGRTGDEAGGMGCVPARNLDFIKDYEDVLDPVDPFLAVTELALESPNDGLVHVEDARWGEFLGCVPADHLDEVGQLFGDSPGDGNGWDHLKFYAGLVDHLRAEGH